MKRLGYGEGTAVCYGCEKRHAGCAIDCPEWQKVVAAREEKYRKNRQRNEVTTAQIEITRSWARVRGPRRHRKGWPNDQH